MKPTMVKAINAVLSCGPSVESEQTLGGKQEELRTLQSRIEQQSYVREDFSDKDANLLIYCLLDYAYYGERMEEVLSVLDEVCPNAAETLRSNNYAFKYQLLEVL